MTYTGESVVLHHITPGGKDKYGDPIASTTTDQTITVKVAPATSDEETDRGRDGIVNGWNLYAPVGTVTAFTDKVTVRGVMCRVQGEPAAWGDAGVVIRCVRA